MKTEFKAKFLQAVLQKKKNDEGFTLIELLVVIIIIGILSAIALPSFLNQANKAKQSEAKTYVGSMNRAQQAYYAENNEFADKNNFAKLGLGVNTQTANYKYVINNGGAGKSEVSNQAQPLSTSAPIKAYVGGVGIGTIGATSEATTVALLCEADQPIVVKNALNGAQDPTFPGGATVPTCPTDYSPVK
ncbi:MAG: type IV pilin-like G/H family protein [Chlorogloeopsis fritschii C42_A2020_084]|uniref:type IV pilin-like G/H family protein n=1 Tax=Chlorogloeopsis fritschii TaxID=1124 RepID=UPI0019E24B0E|nr:type IV pilin-like G/H family protein [Chlorogloeopsis fritschii]MBF2009308.1 type IV pilin-like G/H family protein [Chlorogloeopsis fritschii C42_A2020_084]